MAFVLFPGILASLHQCSPCMDSAWTFGVFPAGAMQEQSELSQAKAASCHSDVTQLPVNPENVFGRPPISSRGPPGIPKCRPKRTG